MDVKMKNVFDEKMKNSEKMNFYQKSSIWSLEITNITECEVTQKKNCKKFHSEIL
jgi:hypothetical protein